MRGSPLQRTPHPREGDSLQLLIPAERSISLCNSPPEGGPVLPEDEFEEAFDLILDGRSTSLPNSRSLGEGDR